MAAIAPKWIVPGCDLPVGLTLLHRARQLGGLRGALGDGIDGGDVHLSDAVDIPLAGHAPLRGVCRVVDLRLDIAHMVVVAEYLVPHEVEGRVGCLEGRLKLGVRDTVDGTAVDVVMDDGRTPLQKAFYHH